MPILPVKSMNPPRSRAFRLLLRAALIFVCVTTLRAIAQMPPPPPSAAGAAYAEGTDALEKTDYAHAIADFTQALAGEPGNGDYLRARGVAYTLSEHFPEAIADLERTLRLNPKDLEAKLWLAAAYRMQGDVATAASYFSITGVPPDYANMVYNELAMDYWSSRTKGSYWDRAQKRNVTVSAPVKALFPEAAAAYAARHRATGPAPAAIAMHQLKEALGRDDWQNAYKLLVSLRRTSPDDTTLRSYLATVESGFGDALHAREEFTRVLCIQPLTAGWYLARAETASRIGDSRRVNADLDTAAALGVKIDPGMRKTLLDPLQGLSGATRRFASAVDSSASFENLIDPALAALREFNGIRMRYDEAYQDRLLAISIAARNDAKNPVWPELLGRFLFNNRKVPVEWSGPRATTQLRPQSAGEQQAEIQRALDSEDAALKLDPRNANALAAKGWLLYTTGNPPRAEELADQCLSVEEKSVPGLRLKSRLTQDHAADKRAEASSLRSPHVDITHEQRSDGEYEIRTTHPPTAEELARAAKLDEEAAVLEKEAARLDDLAAKSENEIIPALIKDGEAALAANNLDAAAASFNRAYVLNPDNRDLLLDLAELANRRGDANASRVYSLITDPMDHTSDTDELKSAWDNITRTAWKEASAALDHAAQIDPVDARIPAYRSVIAAAQGDQAAAERQRAAALALEEARARLMGTSYLRADPTPIVFDEPSLTLLLRLKQGDALLDAGHAQEALDIYSLDLAMEPRMGKAALTGMMPQAMLPDPSLDPNTVPTPPTFASILAECRLGSGGALLALGRPADAQKQYLAVRAYLANWPATAPGRETLNTADAWARLGLAEAAYAAHDLNTAHTLLDSGEGWPWGLPKELDQRRKELSSKVLAEMQNAGMEQIRQLQNQTPEQARARAFQDEIAQMEKQRDQMLAEAAKPETDDRTRQFLKQSADQLQQVIDQRKATLSKLTPAQ